MDIEYYQTIPKFGIKGRMDTPKEFARIGLPARMEKWTVLDIGCNTGAFLLECFNRGARCVTGVEPDQNWRFLAEGILTESIPLLQWGVHKDISEIKVSQDLVLLLSVLHVCENPQAILDKAWELTDRILIVEINDRLQETKIKLPQGAKLIGKNKDNRSVWHIYKDAK